MRYACVINDLGRAAGRSGVGAVMGSKKLKAIAVRGTGGVKVADKARFLEVTRACYEALTDPYIDHFHKHGTPGVLRAGQLLRRAADQELPLRHQRPRTRTSPASVSPRCSRCASAWAWAARRVRSPAGASRRRAAARYAGGRRPRVRDHRHARLELLHERPRGGDAGQLHLQPRRASTPSPWAPPIACAMEMYELGLIPRGRHRLRPAVRRRRGDGEAHGDDGAARGLRRPAGRGQLTAWPSTTATRSTR